MVIVDQVERTCYAAPSQWEGYTVDGRFVYARYRWGVLAVEIAETRESWWACEETPLVEMVIGGQFDSVMTFDELKLHTSGTLAWPERESDVADF